jgi:hypothetical protein
MVTSGIKQPWASDCLYAAAKGPATIEVSSSNDNAPAALRSKLDSGHMGSVSENAHPGLQPKSKSGSAAGLQKPCHDGGGGPLALFCSTWVQGVLLHTYTTHSPMQQGSPIRDTHRERGLHGGKYMSAMYSCTGVCTYKQFAPSLSHRLP